MESIIFVYTTCKNKEEALNIGRTLVQEKLVACVNVIDQMQSIYYWNEELVEDQETILISKTVSSLFQNLEKRIQELHSYSNPCIVSIPIQAGSEPYLEWIRNSISTRTT